MSDSTAQRDWNAELWRWQQLSEASKAMIEEERALRKELFDHFFPAAKDGTNTCDLPLGWKLKGVRPPKRDIDISLFTSMKAATVGQLPPDYCAKLGVQQHPPETPVYAALLLNMDTLVKYTPELVSKTYGTLTDSQRAFFDGCVTKTTGSISLSLVAPKEDKTTA